MLDRVAALDPEPQDLEGALARIVDELGEPTGPIRGVCALFLQEWESCRIAPGYWSWLVAEAIAAGEPRPNERRRGGSAS
jgi:hypothetical protein